MKATPTNEPPDPSEGPEAAAPPTVAAPGRTAPGRAPRARWGRLALMGVVVALSSLFLALLPDLLRGIPLEIQRFVTHPAWPITIAAALLVLGPSRVASVVPRRYRDRLAALAGRALRTPRVAAALAPRTGRRMAPVEGFASWRCTGR